MGRILRRDRDVALRVHGGVLQGGERVVFDIVERERARARERQVVARAGGDGTRDTEGERVDIGFGPGGDDQIARLVHGERAADDAGGRRRADLVHGHRRADRAGRGVERNGQRRAARVGVEARLVGGGEAHRAVDGQRGALGRRLRHRRHQIDGNRTGAGDGVAARRGPPGSSKGQRDGFRRVRRGHVEAVGRQTPPVDHGDDRVFNHRDGD